MKFRLLSFVCAFALSLAPQLVSADEPLPAKATRQIDEGLVKPLASYEASISRFSRVRMPPHERRSRLTKTTPASDAAGNAFLTFAVDVKYGDTWREGDVVGCVYPDSGSIFVKRGDEFRPAAILMGKPGDPVATVCRAAPARS